MDTDIVYKQEIIDKAKQLWINRYSDEFGYVSEKLNTLSNLVVEDYWIAWQMFDLQNQALLVDSLSNGAKNIINNFKKKQHENI